MNIQELMARLEDNASNQSKPVSVQIDGLGTIYVRKRTVREFEEMASVNRDKDVTGMSKEPNGVFAPSLSRLLCDEKGARFPAEHADQLVDLLAKQPEDVFHAIINATDGKTEVTAKAEAEGN